MESSKNNLFDTETKRIAQFTCVSILLFFSLLTSNLIAQSYAKVNINNVSTYVWNDGKMDINPSGNAGFEYWKGTKRFSVIASGVYWGGLLDNEIRVGGTKYRSSLLPQNVEGTQNIFRVRPDYAAAKLSQQSFDENKSEEEIRYQYLNDYKNWPWKLGAPYKNVDDNRFYNTGIDIPGFPNADQTVWLVCNDDFNSAGDLLSSPFLSKPTNFEVQITVWAYSKNNLLSGVLFKKYKLINKSKAQTIKDVYLGVFCDADIGETSDDYAGCDTLLSLGYVYNAKDNDYLLGKNLSTVGVLLLQSPIVEGKDDDIIFKNGAMVRGKKYLGMTSFRGKLFDGDFSYSDRFHYGELKSSYPFFNPITRSNTKFPFSGDPVTKSGFIDGILNPAGDRFIQINSGPFNMAPGDTQEVIFAQIVTSGTSRLGLVSYLKYLAKYVKDFYKNEMFKETTETNKPTEIPMRYSLSQNFPNPFNPSTTIEYTIPHTERVTLKVFDVLGREVATLVNEYKQAGAYKANFNASGLTSGVYFYQLSAGSYVDTKKLILMK